MKYKSSNRNYYKTKNELMSSSLEDMIDTLLYINAKSCEQGIKSLIHNKNGNIKDIMERNIKIGPLLSGEAYYHEKDERYPVIGFMVESECEYKGRRMKIYGFRSIYFGKCHETAPVDFDDASSLNDNITIPNGLGDYVEVFDVLRSQEEVDNCIIKNHIDINKYLKEVKLLLPEKNNDRSY